MIGMQCQLFARAFHTCSVSGGKRAECGVRNDGGSKKTKDLITSSCDTIIACVFTRTMQHTTYDTIKSNERKPWRRPTIPVLFIAAAGTNQLIRAQANTKTLRIYVAGSRHY